LRTPRGDQAGIINFSPRTVQPGTRCRLVNVETKALVFYRVKCGNLDGWTDEADSFDPPPGIGLFGSAE
jgi:hypothetical protein